MSADKAELLLIGVAVSISFSGFVDWPGKIAAGSLVLILSGLFLVQTLVRDLYLLYARNKPQAIPGEQSDAVFCLETTVGIAGVISGTGLIFSGFGSVMVVSDGMWTALVALTMVLCYFLRDYVIQWNPWRIRRDPDHINIVIRVR